MIRQFVVVGLYLGALATTLQAAPVPKAPEFFPTTVGTIWVYHQPAKDYTGVDLDQWVLRTGQLPPDIKDREYAEEIVAAVKKDGATILTIRTTRDGKSTESLLSVTDKGVFSLGTEKHPLKKPSCQITLPPKKGDTWQGTWDPSWTSTVEDTERVEVPAGKYNAVRVDSVSGSGKSRMIVSSWYAPGVGVVQRRNHHGEITHELKSFTLGKPKP